MLSTDEKLRPEFAIFLKTLHKRSLGLESHFSNDTTLHLNYTNDKQN